MVDHDKNVGEMLELLDELGITEDTFVMYSTDNGPHSNTWPDGATTPFRSEKNTNWEGAFRVPLLVRWPGKIKAGSISNGIVQHHDWLPTFLAMAGDADIVERLKSGYKAIGRTYKNHIDGYNLLPYLTGQVTESPRNFYMYFSDDGDVLGMRYDNWKMVFMEQRCEGTLKVWAEPFTRLRIPKMFNLRTDPFEFADITSNTYYDWMIHHAYLMYAAQYAAKKFADTFKEFPAIQKPNTFTIDDAIAKMSEAVSFSEPLIITTKKQFNMYDVKEFRKEGKMLNPGNMVFIDGGSFMMGSDKFYPEEKPLHKVTVDSFWIDKYPVTNRAFSVFVSSTNYVTVAEKSLNQADFPNIPKEDLVPGSMVFLKRNKPVNLKNYANWWRWVKGRLETSPRTWK